MTPWTEEELQIEHKVIYRTRLGSLEVFGDPTPEQHKIAMDEADQAIAKLRGE